MGNGNAPYFIILLCLMPDNFTHQGESGGAQWVNVKVKLKQEFKDLNVHIRLLL
jgi:hypothetical protein